MQVTKGENTAERPMWAEKGGLDFDGRAKWDAWTAAKALKPERAKLNFVKVSLHLKTPSGSCCEFLMIILITNAHSHCNHQRLEM